MIFALAWGLEVGHPFAYAFMAVLAGIPLVAIVVMLIDDWRNK